MVVTVKTEYNLITSFLILCGLLFADTFCNLDFSSFLEYVRKIYIVCVLNLPSVHLGM